MRVQATGKYVAMEGIKALLFVTAGFFGVSILLSILSSILQDPGEASISGMDLTILFLFMGINFFMFNRTIDFTFQNSLSGSARAWGVYLGIVVFALCASLLSVALMPVLTVVFDAFSISTKNMALLTVYQNGVRWGRLAVILLLFLLVGVATLLMNLFHYRMKPLQIALFWLALYLISSILVSALLPALGEGTANNALVGSLADLLARLLPWLTAKSSHMVLFESGLFLVLSACSLFGLSRLQLRKR